MVGWSRGGCVPVTRVGVDLPVSCKWRAAHEDRDDGGDECCAQRCPGYVEEFALVRHLHDES